MAFGLSDPVIEKICSVFQQHPEINKAVIYGSRAMGRAREGSDIDLTLFGDLDTRTLLQISADLDDLLLPWQIDLSLYDQIENDDLREHIERVGLPFYDQRSS